MASGEDNMIILWDFKKFLKLREIKIENINFEIY